MKKLFLSVLLLVAALLLSACSYMVEDPPVQIGEATVYITAEPMADD